MVNLCTVLLDLCMPFCQGDLEKLAKVEPSYSTSKACRLNYDFETCLGGGQIGKIFFWWGGGQFDWLKLCTQRELFFRMIVCLISVCEKEGGSSSHGGLAEDLQGTYNFMTEIFHLTQRAMNVGFFPALVHFKKLQK